MESYNVLEQRLIEKIRSLPPETITEIEEFIDLLYQRNTEHSRAAAKLAEPVFQKIGIIQRMPITITYSFADVILVPFPSVQNKLS